MLKKQCCLKFSLFLFACCFFIGCATVPKGFLKPTEGYMQTKQLQTRQYETTDQEKILSAVTGVLQDLSFTLDDSETKLGLISASKKSSAVDKGQVAAAFFLDILAGVGGNGQAAASRNCDKDQMVKASVITRLSLDANKTVVRVTFQRIVWNMANEIKIVESIVDPDIYKKFYDALSKAIFLEAQQI